MRVAPTWRTWKSHAKVTTALEYHLLVHTLKLCWVELYTCLRQARKFAGVTSFVEILFAALLGQCVLSWNICSLD